MFWLLGLCLSLLPNEWEWRLVLLPAVTLLIQDLLKSQRSCLLGDLLHSGQW